MARQAKIQKDLRLTRTNTKPGAVAKRKELKALISSKSEAVSPAEKWQAALELSKRNKDESVCRQTNRCPQCGRIHGYLRRFGLCRLCVRKFFVQGYLPGVVKSSW